MMPACPNHSRPDVPERLHFSISVLVLEGVPSWAQPVSADFLTAFTITVNFTAPAYSYSKL